MRVDASQVLGQGGLKIKSGPGSAMDSLKEGDVVRAKVISSDKSGTLTLRMENGQSFSAKMGTDIKLSVGDMILLEVSGKEKDQTSLIFSGVETEEEEFPVGQTNLVREFTDKSLAPFASKLAELNMPVTEESARMMRELVGRYPGMSLDEAAFLASNKITGDENLIRAALATLAGGDKTDAMIARILSLLGEQSSMADLELGVRNPDSGVQGSELPGSLLSGDDTSGGRLAGVPTSGTAVGGSISAPLTELLTLIVKNFSGYLPASEHGGQTSSPTAQAIITQPDGNMQTNVEINGNLTQERVSGEGGMAQGDGSAVLQGSGGTPAGETPAAVTTLPSTAGAVSTENIMQGQPAVSGAPSGAGAETIAEQLPQGPAQGATPQDPAPSMASVVTGLLSDIPEFSGTPNSALERFSEMLLRVAGDTSETAGNTDTLATQLDKLFTRIGMNDSDAGARLKDAREELYTRLALIEEALSSAAQPARAEVLAQTQRLMNHVRLLNSIEQFVYMQMPVQLADERKAADLYVFKRKGGKRADPDNVNILLAIDLEYMGHWEALVNIKNKDVSIQMEVPSKAEKDHFNENTVLLHNMLDDAGFKLVSTNIKFSEKETTPLTALSTLDRYTGGKQGIIDFMI